MKSRLHYSVLALIFCWLCVAYLAACSKKNEAYAPAATVARSVQHIHMDDVRQAQLQVFTPAVRREKMPVMVVLCNDEKAPSVSTLRALWGDCIIACVSGDGTNDGKKTIAAALRALSANSGSLHSSGDYALVCLDASWSESMLLYTYTHNTNNYVKCVADMSGASPAELSGVKELKSVYLKPSFLSGSNALALGDRIRKLGVSVELADNTDKADLPQGVQFVKAHLLKS
ncbi:MAG: hypothetical protein QM743_05970 [Chitinophagaceae bacterium]